MKRRRFLQILGLAPVVGAAVAAVKPAKAEPTWPDIHDGIVDAVERPSDDRPGHLGAHIAKVKRYAGYRQGRDGLVFDPGDIPGDDPQVVLLAAAPMLEVGFVMHADNWTMRRYSDEMVRIDGPSGFVDHAIPYAGQ